MIELNVRNDNNLTISYKNSILISNICCIFCRIEHKCKFKFSSFFSHFKSFKKR